MTRVMFVGMIQLDQDHKRVADNIEAAKEKILSLLSVIEQRACRVAILVDVVA
ncbi:TPA: hypothetical protein QCR38_005527 [Bacillus cereus]|nr:hypothetical protein [Bacillus cereus]